ncbi:MAG: methylenetetrahydrofolate reductase [Elusimicrobiota bacterium]|jgi:5,10-methylenetetrahydrofolate reductase|nr:methylenetetrahydrofolate reductase [Elusimicrobiota bacterium]
MIKLPLKRSKLEKYLKNNIFTITAELFPPKGTDISNFKKKALIIKDYIVAVNITDNQRAIMRTSALALSKIILDLGLEPIYQITTRDRNILALQSDILGASILGIKNILVLGGDHPKNGDHKNAIPVYELDSLGLVKTIKTLENGTDYAGKVLAGVPKFFTGTALNPNLKPIDKALEEIRKKEFAGSDFFQTQPIFNISDFLEYKKLCDPHNNKNILVGIMFLKSYNFAKKLANIPGINIPENILKRLKNSNDELNEGIKIASELIKELKDKKYTQGVHIMAIGAEEYIPKILEKL